MHGALGHRHQPGAVGPQERRLDPSLREDFGQNRRIDRHLQDIIGVRGLDIAGRGAIGLEIHDQNPVLLHHEPVDTAGNPQARRKTRRGAGDGDLRARAGAKHGGEARIAENGQGGPRHFSALSLGEPRLPGQQARGGGGPGVRRKVGQDLEEAVDQVPPAITAKAAGSGERRGRRILGGRAQIGG